MPARDGYTRLIFWLINQGYVCDVSARHAQGGATPDDTPTWYSTASGKTFARERARRLQLQVVTGALRDHLRQMARFGCTARLVALSPGGAHEFWYEPSRLQVTDRRSGPLAFAGADLLVENRIFSPAIWQAENLIEGVPWYGAVATDDGSGTYLLEPPARIAYEGLRWEGSSGDSVDDAGEATISSSYVLQFELPAEGATLQLTGCTGTIAALDWDESSLDSASEDTDLVLPSGTWYVKLTVTAATDQPAVEVIDIGVAADPRIGDWDTDCSTRVTTPAWTS